MAIRPIMLVTATAKNKITKRENTSSSAGPTFRLLSDMPMPRFEQRAASRHVGKKRVERNRGYGDSTRFLIPRDALYGDERAFDNGILLPEAPNDRLLARAVRLGIDDIRAVRRPRPQRPTSPRDNSGCVSERSLMTCPKARVSRATRKSAGRAASCRLLVPQQAANLTRGQCTLHPPHVSGWRVHLA